MKLHSEFSTNSLSTSLSTSSSTPVSGRFFVLFILGLLMLGACESKADFSYSNGSEGNYADFSGKWLVINYWAEWCKPCIKEIPELNRFAASNKDVNVIGVNYDILPIEKEQAVIQQFNIQFPVARAFLHEHYGYPMPTALPATIVISPDGQVKKILLGPQTVESLSQSVSE